MNNQAKLSKTVLDMKFMKKTKLRVEQEEEEAQGRAVYSNRITDKMKQNRGNIVFVETTISNCKNLIEGRLSFKGMNPTVEKLLANEDLRKLELAKKQKEKDISDVELAKGYSLLADTRKWQKR